MCGDGAGAQNSAENGPRSHSGLPSLILSRLGPASEQRLWPGPREGWGPCPASQQGSPPHRFPACSTWGVRLGGLTLLSGHMGREAVRRCGAEGRTHAGRAQSCFSRASAHSGHPEESACLPACCAEWSPCRHGFRRPQRQEALALAKSCQSGMCCAVLCVGTCALQSLKPLGEHCPGHSKVAWSLLRCHTEVPGDECLVAGRGLSGAAVSSGSHSLYIWEEVAVRKASWRQQLPVQT